MNKKKNQNCSGQNKRNDIKNNCNVFFLLAPAVTFFWCGLGFFLDLLLLYMHTIPYSVELNEIRLILLPYKQFDMVANCFVCIEVKMSLALNSILFGSNRRPE